MRVSTIAMHMRSLDWQAANPTVTWMFRGIVWIVVVVLLLRPSNTAAL